MQNQAAASQDKTNVPDQAVNLSQLIGADPSTLRNELGDKYDELGDMVG